VGLLVVALVVVAGVTAYFLLFVQNSPRLPVCTVPGVVAGGPPNFSLTPEQAGNAATVAAVGQRLGLPDHAVTIALATAMQESQLVDLTGGDRDSAGLFQQRPSQGWGTYAQVTDPVYASTAFYQHLEKVPGWQTLSVTVAAQQVQRSASPDAYAQWESEARAVAVALTGQTPGALACQNLTVPPPQASLADMARAEWGSSTVAGQHDVTRGWALSYWLVAHATRLGVDSVSFDGRTWTAASGTWTAQGPVVATLSLHQVPRTTSGSGS
jgi:hypothetical protein